MDRVSRFKRDCYSHYLTDLRAAAPSFPRTYTYPDGNPIRPVLPIQKAPTGVMVIGAFPSARFESREGRLIPVADNLSPFGPEAYYDGERVRIQESAHALAENYLEPLGLMPEKLWITDIVKVYLYPDKHIANCRKLFPRKTFVETHSMFRKLADASRSWFVKEVQACNPKLVITLGEVCARVVSLDKRSSTKELLDGAVHTLDAMPDVKVVHLAHPEIRRLHPVWDDRTRAQIQALGTTLARFL
jgi:hypothetical protein